MNEREKVLLQREAVRRWWDNSGHAAERYPEDRIRRLFPLPPEKVPNEVMGAYGVEWRVNPTSGRIQFRNPQNGWHKWRNSHLPENEAAIRAVIAEPYRLVSGEDGE